MKSFYLLFGKQYKIMPFARTYNELESDSSLVLQLSNLNEAPFKMKLLKICTDANNQIETSDLSEITNLWEDYLPNNLAWPLMSYNLKYIIEKNLTGLEGLEWVSVIVETKISSRNYFIPKFKNKLDVLDIKNTIYVKGTDNIVKPAFEFEKVKNYSVFHKPGSYWKIPFAFYVNENIMKQIRYQKIQCVGFEKVSVN